ncbi:L-2-amino-thiazoline-4-carboxylic acid hydrolase [Methanotorris formicicus]|uniref:Uncharacterized protein n=1 Tax=Methanotorris formicicus Mc-S-70 TaxID=647171 RepID=H1KZW3_9EURY|nr:L-2-amino-thiazoline-4-carboxylic acid hydrolase [Methanotorris formicicus]EHP85466.1 hypothetical protein MetfoDRAFT_1337 [Methanotorris formicicus Mc-S-70]
MGLMELKIIKSVLSKELGFFWFVFLIKSLLKKKIIFNRTQWAKMDNEASEFVKRHFIIKECIFHDFFTGVGIPELTKLFCEIDKVFFSKAFPEFEFHRNGSWENTIAYGKDFCELMQKKIQKK